MSSKKKQDTHFSLDSPVITVGKESTSLSNRSTNKTEKSIIIIPRKPLPNTLKLLPYTPPDALMFALFSAIQRRAWIRARKLCYELILCDPLRQNYRDLHDRIDQIVRIMNQRVRPRPPPQAIPTRMTTASSGYTDGGLTMRK